MLGRLAYRNLDELPELSGQVTTTEFLCRWIADQLVAAVDPAAGLHALTVTLREHPDAWASYRLPLG